MADHGRLDPDEPGDEAAPGPGEADPGRGDPSTHDDRDPVALAAWRRVAAQRGRRVAWGPATESPEETDDPERLDPSTVEVPAPGTGGSGSPASPAGLPSTASRLPSVGTGSRPTRPPRPDGPYGAPPEHGGRPSAGNLHDVLLGLAGRIDDDALSSVRELVAVEDDAGAAELLSGCLLADAVAVSAAERAVLEPWFSVTRVDAELLELLPLDDAARERPRHRFVADAHRDDHSADPGRAAASVDAVARAAARLPGVVSMAQCWRITPAGSSSGPLPHRVLLVATDTGVDGEHVAHHVAYAARDLGSVSVEVLGVGADLPAYHRAALEAATPLLGTAPLPAAGTTPPAAEGAGDSVSEADMLLAELPYGGDVPADAPSESPGPDPDPDPDPDPAPPESDAHPSTAAPLLDPDEAAARIAALWSTPAPGDPSPVDTPPVGAPPLETPALEASPVDTAPADPPSPLADDHPEAPVDGVVPRARTSRTGASTLDDAPDDTPSPRVNGHRLGVNGVRHGEVGGVTSPDGPVIEPPTDPVGWPFVAGDVPAGRGEDADGWRVDPSPTGPTAPTPLPPPVPEPEAGRSAVEDSLPELSDRERELLARLHAELAARERQGAEPSDTAPPTTPLPLPGDTSSGSGGTADGQGPPPRAADERED